MKKVNTFYPQYPHHKLHDRIRHLNNRDLAIFLGVIIGAVAGIYGVFLKHFATIPVLGKAAGHGLWFKVAMIILSAGVFGNLLSYVGSFLDIVANHCTIFDYINYIFSKN